MWTQNILFFSEKIYYLSNSPGGKNLVADLLIYSSFSYWLLGVMLTPHAPMFQDYKFL